MSAVIQSGKSSKDLQSQRSFVEQLRRELKVQRVKLSQCANELTQYCEQQGNVDPLISPKASHDNPFRNSGSKCVLFWKLVHQRALLSFILWIPKLLWNCLIRHRAGKLISQPLNFVMFEVFAWDLTDAKSLSDLLWAALLFSIKVKPWTVVLNFHCLKTL